MSTNAWSVTLPAPSNSSGAEPAKTERVLVPLLEGGDSRRSVELALAFAAESGAEVHIINPVVPPERVPLNRPDPMLEAYRDVAEATFHAIVNSPYDISVSSSIRVGQSVPRIVGSIVEEYDTDVVVLDAPSDGGSADSSRSLVEQIARTAGCDVIIANSFEGFDRLASILVPVAGGPHSGLAVDVAAALAHSHGAWIDLIHVVNPVAERDDEASENGERYLQAALCRLNDTERVDTRVLEADDAAEKIVEQSACYDLTVLGVPLKGRLRRFVAGSTTDDVRAAARTPIITVRRDRKGSWLDRWIGNGT